MGFKQPSAKKYPQANVLAGMPTMVTILDIDLVSELVISQVDENNPDQCHLVPHRNQHRILHPRFEHPE